MAACCERGNHPVGDVRLALLGPGPQRLEPLEEFLHFRVIRLEQRDRIHQIHLVSSFNWSRALYPRASPAIPRWSGREDHHPANTAASSTSPRRVSQPDLVGADPRDTEQLGQQLVVAAGPPHPGRGAGAHQGGHHAAVAVDDLEAAASAGTDLAQRRRETARRPACRPGEVELPASPSALDQGRRRRRATRSSAEQ